MSTDEDDGEKWWN